MGKIKIKKIDKDFLISIIISAVMIIFGILFCALPQEFLSIIETILAILLVGYGLICLLIYCFTSSQFRDTSHLISSIVTIILGFLVSVIPTFFIFGIGLVILINGIGRVMTAVQLKNLDIKNWWSELVVGVVIICVGLVIMILCNTNLARNVMMIIFGISLIVNGTLNLIMQFITNKKLEKIAEENKSEDKDFKDYEVK